MNRLQNIIIGILIITPMFLWADGGNCVRYKVAIELVNKERIVGFVSVANYEPEFEFKDISILDYFKRYLPDTIDVYKDIVELNYPVTKYSSRCDYHFTAVPGNWLIKIPEINIQSIDLIEYVKCNKCDDNYQFSLPPTHELNEREIKLLEKAPIADTSFTYNLDDYENQIWIISYNEKIQIEDINKEWIKYFRKVEPNIPGNNWKNINQYYKEFKSRLRLIDVIVFEINYMN